MGCLEVEVHLRSTRANSVADWIWMSHEVAALTKTWTCLLALADRLLTGRNATRPPGQRLGLKVSKVLPGPAAGPGQDHNHELTEVDVEPGATGTFVPDACKAAAHAISHW